MSSFEWSFLESIETRCSAQPPSWDALDKLRIEAARARGFVVSGFHTLRLYHYIRRAHGTRRTAEKIFCVSRLRPVAERWLPGSLYLLELVPRFLLRRWLRFAWLPLRPSSVNLREYARRQQPSPRCRGLRFRASAAHLPGSHRRC